MENTPTLYTHKHEHNDSDSTTATAHDPDTAHDHTPSPSFDYSASLFHPVGVRSCLAQAAAAVDLQSRIVKFIKEKSELDRSYAKSLKRCVERAGFPEQAASDCSWDLFLVSVNSFHSALCANIELQANKQEQIVEKQLAEHSQAHARRIKSLSDQVSKCQRQHAASEEAAVKARLAARQAAASAEAARKEMEADQQRDRAVSEGSSMFDDVLSSFKADYRSLEKRRQTADNAFKAAVQASAALQPVFEGQIKSALIELQTAEIDRLQRNREILSASLVFSLGFFKSAAKSAAAVHQVLDSVRVNEDLMAFIKRQEKSEMSAPIVYEDFSVGSSGPVVSPELAACERDLNQHIQIIIQQGQLEQQQIQHCAKLFDTPLGRLCFSRVLNRQRNTNGGLALSANSFASLGELSRLFLDRAQDNMDSHATQLVMIMSQSFYLAASEPRVFLASELVSHPLWRSMRFWEESFFDSLNQRILTNQAFTEAAAARRPSASDQAAVVYNRQQLAFATLSTFAHNMREFGMSVQAICEFLDKQAGINELSAELLQQLKAVAGAGQERQNEQENK